MDGKVMSQANRKIATRRGMVNEWRKDPRWPAMLKKHAHIPEAECAVCHRKHGQLYEKDDGKVVKITLTINHLKRYSYLNPDAYLTWNPSDMRVECTTCNWMFEKGMIPCPECLKEGRVKYVRWDEGICHKHYIQANPEEARKAAEARDRYEASVRQYNADRAAKRRAKVSDHPCTYHGMNQWCRLKGVACMFSKSKALKPAPVGCKDAKEKIKFQKVKK